MGPDRSLNVARTCDKLVPSCSRGHGNVRIRPAIIFVFEMNPMLIAGKPQRSTSRFVALALVLSFAIQLGACPCNCFEHNAWVQLVGLGHLSTPPSQLIGSEQDGLDFAWVSEVEDHCDGVQSVYLNDARSSLLQPNYHHTCKFDSYALACFLQCPREIETPLRILSIDRACSSSNSRAGLQVYLL